MLANKGAALITALFVTTLVIVTLTLTLFSERLMLWRSQQLIQSEQAFGLFYGVDNWAKRTLMNYALKPEKSQAKTTWPIYMKPITIGDIHINGTIYDVQGKLAINSLAKDNFIRFLQVLDSSLSQKQATVLANDALAWIGKPLPSSPRNSVYKTQKPPYQAAEQQLAHISELRLVRGFSAKRYQSIIPYLSAVRSKKSVKININTADFPVLIAIDKNMTPEVAHKIIAYREENGNFTSLDQFSNLDFIKQAKIKTRRLTLTSHYFLVESIVSMGNVNYIISTLFQVRIKNRKVVIEQRWRRMD